MSEPVHLTLGMSGDRQVWLPPALLVITDENRLYEITFDHTEARRCAKAIRGYILTAPMIEDHREATP